MKVENGKRKTVSSKLKTKFCECINRAVASCRLQVSRRAIIIFSLFLVTCLLQLETAFAGALNVGRNADSTWVSVSAKNPTWRAMWYEDYGYSMYRFNQSYDNGSARFSTEAQAGGYGAFQVYRNSWCHSRYDDVPTIAVVESTGVRFMFYIVADIVDARPTENRDVGEVRDTISVYYDRIVYNRSVVLDSGTSTNSSYRSHVAGFVPSGFADWARKIDDDQKCTEVIGNLSCNAYSSSCAGIDSVSARIYKYATFNDTVFTEYLYHSQIGQDYEVEHDDASRRGLGWNRAGAVPTGTYNHVFQFRIATDDTLGNKVQDKFMDLLSPASITCTYGDTATFKWHRGRGCYNYQDTNNKDSVQFTLTKASWADTVFRPVIQIHHWNEGAPDTIKVGGVKKVLNTDFYADTAMYSNDTLLVVHYFTDLTANTEFIIPGYEGAPPAGGDPHRLKRIIQQGIGGLYEKNCFISDFISGCPVVEF